MAVFRRKVPGQAWETVEDTDGGGGSAVGTLECGFIDALGIAPPFTTFAFEVGPSDTTNSKAETTLTTMPEVVGPNGNVVEPGVTHVTGIPDDSEAWILRAWVFVTDLTGANVLRLTAVAATTPGDSAVAIDWATATPTAIAGSDLSWDTGDIPAVVKSTAGGVFVAMLTVQGAWDN